MFLVKSNQVPFRFFFESEAKAIDLYNKLKLAYNGTIFDLEMKNIVISDEKDVENLLEEVYKRIYAK